MHKLCALLLTVLCLAACGQQAKTFDWKEEVQLHDGRKIIAERLDVLGGGAEPGQERAPKERSITFADPDNPSKTYTHKITGSSNYLLLDFDKGVPWLIVDVGPFSTDTKCPIGTYETFTWANGLWQSLSYKNLPVSFKQVNMLVDYQAIDPFREKRGQLLLAIQIQNGIKKLKDNFAIESSWKLVQLNSQGRPIDCDYYRKLAEGKK
jgi:hypothetical protein